MYGNPDKSGHLSAFIRDSPRFTTSPSLVLIGLVLTEIQAFKNVKNLQRNVWKSG